MSPNTPMESPAPARTFSARVVVPMHSMSNLRDTGPWTVTVNDQRIAEGQQSAELLAELGIVREDLAKAWGRFAQSRYPADLPQILNSGTAPLTDFEAMQNQAGACWTLDATVDGAGVQSVRDLAYVDLRDINRTVRYTVRVFDLINFRELAERDFDQSRNRTSRLVTGAAVTLEPGSAVGSWYSGIKTDEIDATYAAAHHLEAARRELERAANEINIAIRVADAAWKGDRADAAKYKFCLEETIAESMRDVTHGWEDYTQDVVRLQRLARDQDVKFLKEVATEVGITILTAVVTFGASALFRGALFVEKLMVWAKEIDALRAIIETRFGQTVARLAETRLAAESARVVARGAGAMSSRATVKGVTGQQIDFGDWVDAFVFAGVVGQFTSSTASAGLRQIEQRFGVTFSSDAERGAAQGAVQGVPRSVAAMAGPADASLGSVMTAYPTGIVSQAVKSKMRAELSAKFRTALKADPQIRAAVEADIEAQVQKKMIYLPILDRQKAIDELVDQAIDKRADAAVDKYMDYLFTAGTQSAANATQTAAAGSDFSGGEVHTDAGGLVVQRSGQTAMPPGSDLATSK
jgi:hypothetical protein